MKTDIIKRIALIMLPLIVSSVATAQNDFQKIFDEFKKSNEQQFHDFRDKANAEYSDFLRLAWTEFYGNPPMTKPKIKPIVPPVVIHDFDKKPEDIEIKHKEEIPTPKPSPVPEPIAPIEETIVPEQKYFRMHMYGTLCVVRFDQISKPELKGVDENSVADFWEELSSSDQIENLLYDFIEFRKTRALGDWAFYKFTEGFSKEAYKDDMNAAVVMHSYILTQSGFRLRIGYSENDRKLHHVVATDDIVFNHQYWELDGIKYYLFDEAQISSMSLSNIDFTSSTPMRISSVGENRFDMKLSSKRHLTSKVNPEMSVDVPVNMNLLEFYNGYPASSDNSQEVVSQWMSYAQTPLSVEVREQLYPQMKTILKGKTELEAVAYILNFVQTAFIYKYDEDIWGYDRSFFAEESLYYPYCDCEDRSILFSHLVRDLVGLDVALIYSPGHLFTAVNFTQDVAGAHIMVGERKFVICEPTFVDGAPVGRAGVDMNETDIKVGVLGRINYN